MSDYRIGSLFSGYGGLDMAVRAALGGGEVLWHADIKPASIALLEHRHPGVPNLGDMTRAFPVIGPITREAAALAPINVLAASWPCQPHSSAGKRLGEADPRALWPNVVRAVAETRPAFFFGENVARITSNGELRRVVRSLADLGYVGAWRVLNASDIGAPHKRSRGFVVAVDPTAAYTSRERDTDISNGGNGEAFSIGAVAGSGVGNRAGDLAAGVRHVDRAAELVEPGPDGGALHTTDRLTLLPTPTQNMTTGAGRQGREGGMNLQTAAVLIPTPRESDAGPRGGTTGFGLRNWSREVMDGRPPGTATPWGVYTDAVLRWGRVLGRGAPRPTQLGPRGGFQLAPPFVEWMMGLPLGWVCDVPVLAFDKNGGPRPAGNRNAALSLLGDGVVPQQGAAAFTFLLDHLARRLAVA